MRKIDLIEDFRSSSRIKALLRLIHKELDREINIMEVCGGHTHTIVKYGLNQIVPKGIRFIHGPGCPVCVMPKERIDQAIALSEREDVILVTLGDMIKVPGSNSSLAKKRAEGRDVRVVYSPIDSVRIARDNPGKKVVYFAIGFETTAPMTASVIDISLEEGIRNLFFHINHILIPPAMSVIMERGESNIDAFIAPSHVSVITGASMYNNIVEKYRTPLVVAGFEPVDVLGGVLMIIRQFKDERREVEIQYRRAVSWDGNRKAQYLIKRFFKTRDSFRWRGLGDIPASGLQLREEYEFMDAEVVFSEVLPKGNVEDHRLCICGDILRGVAKPTDCSVFGIGCSPTNPLGACMVSSEGACAVYYKYGSVDG